MKVGSSWLRRGALAVAVAAAVFFASVVASGADLVRTQTLKLNSFAAGPPTGMTHQVVTDGRLTAGTQYLITVTGTYSAYKPALMAANVRGWKLCGTGVGGRGRRRGQDGFYIFALPLLARPHCPRLPFAHGNFVLSLDGGSARSDFSTPAGAAASYATSHAYSFTITGQGHPARFAILDTNTTDNYGELTVKVAPAG